MVNVTPIHDEEAELYEKIEVEEGLNNDDSGNDAEESEKKSEEPTEAEKEALDELADALAEEIAEEIAEDIAEVAAEVIKAEENDEDFEDEDDDEEDEDDDDYEEDVSNETIYERIVALKGAVPPSYRYGLFNVSNTVYSAVSTTLKFSGKAIWIITTSSLLLGVPLTLSVISEQQLIEMEKEMNLSQASNDVLAPGAESGFQQPVAPVA